MAQRGWTINLSKCIGCHACEVACQKENNTAPDLKWRKVVEKESGTFPNVNWAFITMACFHCANPACIPACPVNAITKDVDDGVVLIDQDACIGCKYCIAACPYGAPQYNEKTEKVEKCTFCKHRVGDLASPSFRPACVDTCVGEALNFGMDIAQAGNEPTGFSDRTMTNPSVRFEV